MIENADGSIVLTTSVDTSGIDKGLTKIKSNVSAFSSYAKAAFAGIAVAGVAAIAKITKSAVDAYADYEQLVGGVETIFKGAAGKVQKYAEDAFYTAGVSANDYMRQVTSFSASLISSLGGDVDKAADVANMALKDMSDNANKMGSDLSTIQSAYMSLSRQQYQLLDNLKIGYGGTKAEAERLLKDAEKLTGKRYDITQLADVYEAIHAIQEQLGITGTTAEEAEKTISGSANMAKAAWQNLLVAISSGKGIDKAIQNFAYSVSTFIQNIVPVIEQALIGLGQVVEKLLPILVERLVKLVIQATPRIIKAIFNMFIGVIKGFWEGLIALFTGDASTMNAVLNVQNDIADSSSLTADNYSDMADSAEKTAKAVERQLMGFDKINKLGNTALTSAAAALDSINISTGNVNLGTSGITGDLNLNLPTEEQQTSYWSRFITLTKNSLEKARNSINGNAKEFVTVFGTDWENASPGEKITSYVVGTFQTVGETLMTGIGEKTVDNISDWLDVFCTDWENATPLQLVGAAVLGTFQSIGDFIMPDIEENTKTHINEWLSVFGTDWENANIGQKLGAIILGTFQGIGDGIIGIFKRVWQKVINIFSDITSAYNEYTEYTLQKTDENTSKMMNNLKQAAESPGALSPENSNFAVTGDLRSFKPGDVPATNKKTVRQYPAYATGTVIPANYGSFLAILGDNKRETEVVSPLSTIKQALSEAMRENGNGDITLVVELDGDVVYRSVVDKNRRNTLRTGANALA